MKKLNYISLFSGAGVGCFGFKLEGFECIATNELIERRLNVQKCNNKCKYESGYICGDITKENTKEKLFDEVKLWKKKEKIDRVDVIIATPPCQGMSVANHKKNEKEIVRNSLVIESIKIIKEINPRFFIFENVPSFMKTLCTDLDGKDKSIMEAINCNLSSKYSYAYKVINFKNYGACSSRQRTLVIGVSKEIENEITPIELFPSLEKEKTLRSVIGSLKSLHDMGQIDDEDIYHFFRPYPEYMREWIHDLKEGESAFDNDDELKRPHRIIDGKIVPNIKKNADKYTRQYWEKVGPCVHTRNDQLASQNTIHPQDDRVFSIRELMLMMTIPTSFKWSEMSLEELNLLSEKQKKNYLKKEEINIRQSLGEAVPTIIFKKIAHNIKKVSKNNYLNNLNVNKIIQNYDFKTAEDLLDFINNNPLNLSYASLSKIAELVNTKRTDNAAYFTEKSLIAEMLNQISVIESETIHILEPSVGVGNFIPLIIKKFEGKEVYLDVVDIDENSIKIMKAIMKYYDIPKEVHINFIVDDFLLHDFKERYDYIIGNPPFYKLNSHNINLNTYKSNAFNKDTNNICSFFLDKAMQISNYIAFVFPKFLLNTPEFSVTRNCLKNNIETIIDFGEEHFPGVLIETIAIFVNMIKTNSSKVRVISTTQKINIVQKTNYIFSDKLPYWILYRNSFFDEVLNKLKLNCFEVFRDRQITKAHLKTIGDIRVIKSRNIADDGSGIVDILGYDAYIEKKNIKNLTVLKYLNDTNVFLAPNMTYKPRVIRKPNNTIVNGSVAILIPKNNENVTDEQLKYLCSNEYRTFYRIARNFQTRSLNIDSCSIYFFGLLK